MKNKILIFLRCILSASFVKSRRARFFIIKYKPKITKNKPNIPILKLLSSNFPISNLLAKASSILQNPFLYSFSIYRFLINSAINTFNISSNNNYICKYKIKFSKPELMYLVFILWRLPVR